MEEDIRIVQTHRKFVQNVILENIGINLVFGEKNVVLNNAETTHGFHFS